MRLEASSKFRFMANEKEKTPQPRKTNTEDEQPITASILRPTQILNKIIELDEKQVKNGDQP